MNRKQARNTVNCRMARRHERVGMLSGVRLVLAAVSEQLPPAKHKPALIRTHRASLLLKEALTCKSVNPSTQNLCLLQAGD